MLSFWFIASALLISLCGRTAAAPLLTSRANPCFVTGNVALPAEVADGLAGLSGVTCNVKVQVAPGVPDVISGGIAYSTIDFQKSSLSPVGFALQTFKTPSDPAQADLTLLQNQLNDYLAVEAGLRSQSSSVSGILADLKGSKFFLQFQISRVQTALGQTLDAADTVDHQLGKVVKNAVGASSAELAQVSALATQL